LAAGGGSVNRWQECRLIDHQNMENEPTVFQTAAKFGWAGNSARALDCGLTF
jgi:hypothetical protein